MKRIAIFGLVLCFFLLLGNVFAREKKLAPAQEKESTKWDLITKGVFVQRLWSKDEWPEVAVLKLSDDAYKEFREDSAKFINTSKIFPAQVKPSGICVSLTAPQEPGGVWFVLIGHGRPSREYCAAIPEPEETEKKGP
jgi:hypothetical protein